MALKIIKARPPVSEAQPATLAVPAKDNPLEAIRMLEQVLAAEPSSAAVFTELERLCRQVDQKASLQGAFLTRLNAALDPEALNRLGVLLFQEGRRREALRCFETAWRYGSEQAKANLRDVQRAKREPHEPKTIDPEIEKLLNALNPKLSACLIVKNEERFLAQCLESLKGIADEIVVVDTGSTDATVKIAKRHGAKVYHFDWCDDFSAARNASLEHATGDWVLVIDADERLTPESRQLLREAIAVPGMDAYFVELESRLSNGNSSVAALPRLFRRHDAARYAGRIHEQITPQFEALGYRQAASSVRIVHEGYQATIVEERDKAVRNLKLLEKQLGEAPDDPYMRYLMGKQLYLGGTRLEEALVHFEAACAELETMSPLPPAGAEVYATTSKTLRLLGRAPEAMDVVRRGLALYPDYPDTRFELGVLLSDLGRYAEAVATFRHCRSLKGRTYVSEHDPSCTGWRATWAEAKALRLQGRPLEAVRLLEGAIEEESAAPAALTLELAEAYLAAGQPTLALANFYGLPAGQLEDRHWKRVAIAHFHQGDYAETIQVLGQLAPEALGVSELCLLGECELALGGVEKAQRQFAAALALDPASTASATGEAACCVLAGDMQGAKRLGAQADPYILRLVSVLDGAAPEGVISSEDAASWALLVKHALLMQRLELPEALIALALSKSPAQPALALAIADGLLQFDAVPLALELLQAAEGSVTHRREHAALKERALRRQAEVNSRSDS